MTWTKQGSQPPQRVGVREFRGNMTDFLRQVSMGRSFLITSHNTVLAELHPPATPVRPYREPGLLRGQIRMAADFDVLPPEVLDAMEVGEV